MNVWVTGGITPHIYKFGTLKANSRISCRVAKDLDCVFPIWITVRPCFIHTYLAVPLPSSDHAALQATAQGHGTTRQGHGMVCVNKHRPSLDGLLGSLPMVGVFRLPRGLLRLAVRIFPDTRGLSQRNWHGRSTSLYVWISLYWLTLGPDYLTHGEKGN